MKINLPRALVLTAGAAAVRQASAAPVSAQQQVLQAAPKDTVTLPFRFDEAECSKWIGEFGDHPVGANWTFYAGPAQMPEGKNRTGYLLTGNNHSDDLWMYAFRSLNSSEVKPGVDYDVQLKLDFASNQPLNSFGVGGSPGSSVYLKGHVVDRKPARLVAGTEVRFNLDKGNQGQYGKDALNLGVYGKDEVGPGADDNSWQMQSRTAQSNAPVRKPANGDLYATTDFYVEKLEVKLTER
jgi:hypothetical protein